MIKFILLLICLFLLTFGIILQIDIVTICGGIFYFLALCIGIIELVMILKRHRDNKPFENKKKKIVNKLARIIEGFVLVSSLVMMLFAENSKGLAITASIIWVGSILLYFLSGIIIESISKIPLDFGYGGWKIKRFKTRRRR
jgi:glucose uptake protein GlcU